jgi:hypothetical protein
LANLEFNIAHTKHAITEIKVTDIRLHACLTMLFYDPFVGSCKHTATSRQCRHNYKVLMRHLRSTRLRQLGGAMNQTLELLGAKEPIQRMHLGVRVAVHLFAGDELQKRAAEGLSTSADNPADRRCRASSIEIAASYASRAIRRWRLSGSRNSFVLKLASDCSRSVFYQLSFNSSTPGIR